MGAWGAGPFDNDMACDWAADLPLRGLALVEETLDAVCEVGDYLDADDGAMAVAAAEVVAKLRGKGLPTTAYTEKVDAWVAAHGQPPSAELVTKALSALDRVAGADSELAELWEGSEEWTCSIDDLRVRLAA